MAWRSCELELGAEAMDSAGPSSAAQVYRAASGNWVFFLGCPQKEQSTTTYSWGPYYVGPLILGNSRISIVLQKPTPPTPWVVNTSPAGSELRSQKAPRTPHYTGLVRTFARESCIKECPRTQVRSTWPKHCNHSPRVRIRS